MVTMQQGFLAKFFALRSRSPVVKCTAPSSQTAATVVTCGRAFGPHRRQPVRLGRLQLLAGPCPWGGSRSITAVSPVELAAGRPEGHDALSPPTSTYTPLRARAPARRRAPGAAPG